MPWRTRSAMSCPGVCAAAHNAEASMNHVIPMR